MIREFYYPFDELNFGDLIIISESHKINSSDVCKFINMQKCKDPDTISYVQSYDKSTSKREVDSEIIYQLSVLNLRLNYLEIFNIYKGAEDRIKIRKV